MESLSLSLQSSIPIKLVTYTLKWNDQSCVFLQQCKAIVTGSVNSDVLVLLRRKPVTSQYERGSLFQQYKDVDFRLESLEEKNEQKKK